MHFYGVVGTALYTYGPAICLYLFCLRHSSVLCILLPFGMFCYTISSFISSILWSVFGSSIDFETNPSISTTFKLIFMEIWVQELVRIGVFFTLYLTERQLTVRAHLFARPSTSSSSTSAVDDPLVTDGAGENPRCTTPLTQTTDASNTTDPYPFGKYLYPSQLGPQ
jgi:hypothetical protein